MDAETRDVARAGPGPVYDTALRWLVATDPLAVCRWLGEEPLEPPVLLSESLPATAVYADALVRTAPDRLLHMEFVRRIEPDLGARMLECRARIMRLHPGMALVQHVLVLADGTMPARFEDAEYSFRLHVSYLRTVDVRDVLAQPSLAPLAVLAHAVDQEARVEHFARSLEVIGDGPGGSRAEGLSNAAGVLAALRLSGRTIRRAWKESFMSALTREDFEKFYNALQPANEQERLEDIEYEKARPTARVLAKLMDRKYGYDLRRRRIPLALAQNFSLDEALDLIEAADSYDALEAKL